MFGSLETSLPASSLELSAEPRILAPGLELPECKKQFVWKSRDECAQSTGVCSGSVRDVTYCPVVAKCTRQHQGHSMIRYD